MPELSKSRRSARPRSNRPRKPRRRSAPRLPPRPLLSHRAARRVVGRRQGNAGCAMTAQDKRVCVGVVTGAHGVRGAVRLKSFTAEPEDVAAYGPLQDERGERHFALRLVGSAKGVLIAAISGIDDRDRAEALRGLRLYLPRSALPPPEEEEYYHADL